MKFFSLLIPLKKTFQFSSKNKILQYASVFLVVLAVLFSQNVYSQARAFTNPGLEFGVANGGLRQMDTNFGFGATFDAGVTESMPWYTSHPVQAGNPCGPTAVGSCHPVEVWGTGLGGVPAAQGTNFVELNAYVSSMIYQNLYLVNGDQITYYFRHRARDSNIEKAAMVIEDQSEVNIATIYTTPSSNTSSWSVNSGVYSYTGPTGLYRVGFRATAASDLSKGNFLDDVRISMNPIIDMKFSNLTTNCEGNSHGSIFLRINGRVNDPTTVAFELINPLNGSPFVTDADLTLTAVANSNGTPVISHTAGTNIYTVTIPIGNYDGGTTLGYSSPTNDEDGIKINVASVTDGAEGKETFKFEIKAQNTNGATNNFVSTSSPVFGDPYVGTTNDGFIEDLDSDGDGVANFCDLDDDNDGILDTAEICKSAISTDFFDGQSTTVTTVSGANVVPTTATITPAINRYNIGWHYGDATGAVNKEMSINFNNPVYFANDNIDFSLGGLDNGSSFGNFFVVYEDGVRLSNLDFSLTNITGNITTSTINGAKAFNSGAATNSSADLTLNGVDRTKRIVKMGYTVHVLTGNSGTSENIRPRIQIDCDMDGDGIPNQLDLDSDGDGCLDAIEGDENVTAAQLVNAGGTVTVGTGSTAPNQNLCASGTCVDSQGVPLVVNSGGSVDIGGDQGQGVGSSANAAVNACKGTISDINCANNGTFEDATDDYMYFKLMPISTGSATTYNLTATFGGNPATVTFMDNTAATNVLYDYPTYFKIPINGFGAGDFTLTVTPNGTGTAETLTVTNTGSCSTTCLTNSTGNQITYYYSAPFLDADLNNAAGIVPKFDEGTTRVLTDVKVEYGMTIAGDLGIKNNNATSSNIRLTQSSDLFFDFAGYSFSASGIISAQNPSYPGTNNYPPGLSTLYFSKNYSNSVTYNAAVDLANFKGTGSFPNATSTLTGNSLLGGGGNVNIIPTTKASYFYKVTYTYNCSVQCYDLPNTTTTGPDTKHGITLLQRAGADNGNWPMIRKSAHTALESNTKGFVITRMTTAEITAIVSPQEGMMVYDTVAKCLKLYDGTAWSCFNTPACP